MCIEDDESLDVRRIPCLQRGAESEEVLSSWDILRFQNLLVNIPELKYPLDSLDVGNFK